MIVIDTNIISEVMKPSPSLAVLKWLNQQNSNSLFVSTITLGEIEYGSRILPSGKRRSELKERFEQFMFQAFRQRILVFDEASARSYGEVMGHRKELGCPMSERSRRPNRRDCSIQRLRYCHS